MERNEAKPIKWPFEIIAGDNGNPELDGAINQLYTRFDIPPFSLQPDKYHSLSGPLSLLPFPL